MNNASTLIGDSYQRAHSFIFGDTDYESDISDIHPKFCTDKNQYSNSFAQLDSAQLKYLKKLIKYLIFANENKTISNRTLEKLLTPEEYANYLNSCVEIWPGEELLDEVVPHCLNSYIALVKKADLLNANADRVSQKASNYQSAKKLRIKAEACYEEAIERLFELLDSREGAFVEMWLDRVVTQNTFTLTDPAPDCIQIPRIIGSSSQYTLQQLPAKQTFLKRKIAVLTTLCNSIEKIIYLPAEQVIDIKPRITIEERFKALGLGNNELDY